MKQTKVINIKSGDRYDIYIGRNRGSACHFGNPFVIGPDGTREDVIRKFDLWIRGVAYTQIESHRRAWILQNIEKLRGKTLGCYCKPLACHGDIYIQLLQEAEEHGQIS